MDIEVFTPRELMVVLGALRHVATVNARFTQAEKDLIEGVARIHGMELDAERLEPVAYEQVARVVLDPHRRKRAVQLAIVTALVEGTPSPETGESVRRFARALGLDEGGLDVLYELSQGRALLARVDMTRRIGRFLRNTREAPGFLDIALPLIGIGNDDPVLAHRYRALGNCGRGTLGRAVFDHYVHNGFEFPGTARGVPAFAAFHEIGHVLSGYGTDPRGELNQAAFQAGFARKDGFSFLLFGILQFHIGLRIAPLGDHRQGLFDVAQVLEALERGAACQVDLGAGFDLFRNKGRSLEEVRSELGIPRRQRLGYAARRAGGM
jgi:hypothetical protein